MSPLQADSDAGHLLEEHLDELEELCSAKENHVPLCDSSGTPMGARDEHEYVVTWHNRHDRQLLEAARWALANGWARDAVVPEAIDTGPSLQDRFTDVLKTLFIEDIKNSAVFRGSLIRTIANEWWMHSDTPNESLHLYHGEACDILYNIAITHTGDLSRGYVSSHYCRFIVICLALSGWVPHSPKYVVPSSPIYAG